MTDETPEGGRAMGLLVADDGWRIPDELWAQIEPLIPPGKPLP
jgi:hypothetical protein